VFAIAITLLVLELHVPGKGEVLVRSLEHEWPRYPGYFGWPIPMINSLRAVQSPGARRPGEGLVTPARNVSFGLGPGEPARCVRR